MDILMVSWDSIWRNAVKARRVMPTTHTAAELTAYARSLKRSNPSEAAFRVAG